MHHIIRELESDNSRLAKEEIILREAKDDNDIFFKGCQLACGARTTFGIKQVPESSKDGPGLDWDTFLSTAELFINRDLTGNMARAAVQGLMEAATMEEWNGWYRRILVKDLDCGIGEKSINKIVKKAGKENYVIPVFTCQLAFDANKHESKITGEKQIEIKLNGIRLITIVHPDGRVDQFSRTGNQLENFPHVREEFSKLAADLNEPMVFDGEIMSKTFQDIMKQVNRKFNVQAQDAVLYLFDWLSYEDFKNGVCYTPQITRSHTLKQFIDEYDFESIRQVGFETIDFDTEEGEERLNEINDMVVQNNYEGIMIKDPSAPYVLDRTVSWLKQKPFVEVSLTVTGFKEGTKRNKGRLGALVCEGEDDGTYLYVDVGSGFSDADRISFWNNRNNIMGQVVEIRGDMITQNQQGTYSLRHPRFLRFRGFKPGEKL